MISQTAKQLIKLLVEQEYGLTGPARQGYAGRDSGDPDRSPEEEMKLIREWMSRLGLLMDDMRRKGYYSAAKPGEVVAKALRSELSYIKDREARKTQKEKQASRPYGRIPGVNDIPRPNKKPKPAL